jgi:hypothetical protein
VTVEVGPAVVGIGLAAYLAKTSSTNFNVSVRHQRLANGQLLDWKDLTFVQEVG